MLKKNCGNFILRELFFADREKNGKIAKIRTRDQNRTNINSKATKLPVLVQKIKTILKIFFKNDFSVHNFVVSLFYPQSFRKQFCAFLKTNNLIKLILINLMKTGIGQSKYCNTYLFTLFDQSLQ